MFRHIVLTEFVTLKGGSYKNYLTEYALHLGGDMAINSSRIRLPELFIAS